MAGSTMGTLFRVTTWGESHGQALGCVIEGCPPGLNLDEARVQEALNRRKPGSSQSSTKRKEPDSCEILSGVFEGKTTGTPISILVRNKDTRSEHYLEIKDCFRPGHGDFTYMARYGIRDWRGGGRASGRETVGRVAAGAVADCILEQEKIQVHAFTLALGGIRAEIFDMEHCMANPYHCPDNNAAMRMDEKVREARGKGDSLGGIVEVHAENVPPGLGDPVFGKLDADLASALMGIGSVKGIEIGDGFALSAMQGSEANDPMGESGFLSNRSGGILAGISNGERIVLRMAVKPVPSIAIPQKTVDIHGKSRTIEIHGRHDVSVIPRILPVAEAMVKIVLADHLLRLKALR